MHHGRYAGKPLGKCESFLNIEPEALYLTAVKKAESGNGTIYRFYNPLDEAVVGKMTFKFPVSEARIVKLNEEIISTINIIDPKVVEVKVPKKKIMTLMIKHSKIDN